MVEEKKKRIVKIAVHYRRARQLSDRGPTGTPTARANKSGSGKNIIGAQGRILAAKGRMPLIFGII